MIRQKYEIDYVKMGYRVGYVHVYVENGSVRQIAEKVRQVNGTETVTIHVGNSDIVARYVCQSNTEILSLLERLKHIDGVAKVVWSEEVDTLPANQLAIV